MCQIAIDCEDCGACEACAACAACAACKAWQIVIPFTSCDFCAHCGRHRKYFSLGIPPPLFNFRRLRRLRSRRRRGGFTSSGGDFTSDLVLVSKDPCLWRKFRLGPNPPPPTVESVPPKNHFRITTICENENESGLFRPVRTLAGVRTLACNQPGAVAKTCGAKAKPGSVRRHNRSGLFRAVLKESQSISVRPSDQ